MNKIMHLAVVIVLLQFALLVAGPLVIQQASADAVTNTTVPKQVKKPTKHDPGRWETHFNVTNNGTNREPIYDVHMLIRGTNIIKTSRPNGWSSNINGQWVNWSTTKDSDAIPNGFKNEKFDITTDSPTYSVFWETTNKTHGIIDSGSFNV